MAILTFSDIPKTHTRQELCGWLMASYQGNTCVVDVDRGKSHTDLLQNNVAIINSGWACHLGRSDKIMTSSPHPTVLNIVWQTSSARTLVGAFLSLHLLSVQSTKYSGAPESILRNLTRLCRDDLRWGRKWCRTRHQDLQRQTTLIVKIVRIVAWNIYSVARFKFSALTNGSWCDKTTRHLALCGLSQVPL